MFSAQLFLGLPVDAALAQALESIGPQIAALFIRDDDHYLRDLVDKNVRYLGKFAGQIHDIAGLDLLEKNIYSLLKKLVPDYPYEAVPLLLFSAEGNEDLGAKRR